MNNYIFGAHFDELWRLDLRSYAWRKVEPRAGPRPPKRALHSAVELDGSMYVYAGLGLADTWPDRLTLGRSDTIPVCCTDSCSQHLTESQSLISTEPEAICKPIRGAFVESNGRADG